ncbi:hypothetical protein MCOR31_004467 [Pyricularia oryzae]|nr:hypothetical protein MCOR31_004467 [Pyricularia oryzae]
MGDHSNDDGAIPFPTLIRPPPEDPNKAPIENVLDVTEMTVLGRDVFTNTRPAWQPPGARGIFGGSVIAMCLSAGQKTVPANFLVHSCHCYFLLAGANEVPILFHVERVRDGRSYATRTVQARQRGRCIFTTTISFVKETPDAEHKENQNVVRHSASMPADAGPPPPDDLDEVPQLAWLGPFQSRRIKVTNMDSPEFHNRKSRQWTRARGKISAQGGVQAHMNALAYVTDSYFIGTISRIHKLWRFPVKVDEIDTLDPWVVQQIKDLHEFDGGGDLKEWADRPTLGMMVSLDHSIYFHEPRSIKADEWMFQEMESPWSGDGRGVVIQRIFNKEGVLVATCVQEGIVRLKPKEEEETKAKL